MKRVQEQRVRVSAPRHMTLPKPTWETVHDRGFVYLVLRVDGVYSGYVFLLPDGGYAVFRGDRWVGLHELLAIEERSLARAKLILGRAAGLGQGD